MKLFLQFFVFLFLFINSVGHAEAENVFYILHEPPDEIKNLNRDLSTVNEHHRSIQLLITQAYHVDDKGSVAGFINPELMSLANKNAIKLIALITNSGFDQNKIHQFLTSERAQDKALQFILDACQKYHLYGVQFDFEKVSINDKNLLTAFFTKAYQLLHQKGFLVSYAIIPAFTDNLDQSIFLRRTYQHWSGVYDLKALGKNCDFVTIMAYNQHPDGTIPGPTASISFVEAAIKNTLKDIPADKLSLGIPAYSLYWFSGHSKVSMQQLEISYKNANQLINENHANFVWNPQDKINYAIYQHNWLNEYIFLEDVNSFKAKLALVKKFKLRGISVFRIGTEDNRIWSVL